MWRGRSGGDERPGTADAVDRLVEAILRFSAPRGPLNVVVQGTLYLLVVHLISLWAEIGLAGRIHMAPSDRFLTTAIAGVPFILFIMFLLSRYAAVNERLARLAATDVLTGIANRRGYFAELQAAMKTDGGYLLIIDADHFKAINDAYGHVVGDMCLRAIARHLRGVLADGQPLGRIGGEEFSAFLKDTGESDLRDIGQRLTGPIVVDIGPDHASLRLTMSVGASETAVDEDLSGALRRADTALYRAKANGRARVELERHARRGAA